MPGSFCYYCRMQITNRPWGSYTVLYSSPKTQVKILRVAPGGRLSYQTHEKRSEYWVIVAGEGTVTLDGVQATALAGDAYVIDIGVAHRIENIGTDDLIFTETQIGLYFGEDDIIRLSDDYGRAEDSE